MLSCLQLLLLLLLQRHTPCRLTAHPHLCSAGHLAALWSMSWPHDFAMPMTPAVPTCAMCKADCSKAAAVVQAWNLTGDAFTPNPGDKPWISEMYGYSFGCSSNNVWHRTDESAMLYPGYMPYGTDGEPATLDSGHFKLHGHGSRHACVGL